MKALLGKPMKLDGYNFFTGQGDSLHLEDGGIHEPHIVDFLKNNITQGDTFVDVGAHIGYFTVLAAGLTSNTIAFEPSPKAYEVLCENTIRNLNSFLGTDVWNIAIGNEIDGKVILHEQSEGWGQNSLAKDLVDRGEHSPVEVKCDTLDMQLYTYGDDIKSIVLKSDTQGNESNVLKGFRETLQSGKVKAMALEIWPKGLETMGSSVKELYDLIGPNYKIQTHVITPGNKYHLIDCPYEECIKIYGNNPGQREHGDLLCTRK